MVPVPSTHSRALTVRTTSTRPPTRPGFHLAVRWGMCLCAPRRLRSRRVSPRQELQVGGATMRSATARLTPGSGDQRGASGAPPAVKPTGASDPTLPFRAPSPPIISLRDALEGDSSAPAPPSATTKLMPSRARAGSGIDPKNCMCVPCRAGRPASTSAFPRYDWARAESCGFGDSEPVHQLRSRPVPRRASRARPTLHKVIESIVLRLRESARSERKVRSGGSRRRPERSTSRGAPSAKRDARRTPFFGCETQSRVSLYG